MKANNGFHIIISASGEKDWLKKEWAGQSLLLWTVKTALQSDSQTVWVNTADQDLKAWLQGQITNEQLQTGIPTNLPDSTAIMQLHPTVPLLTASVLNDAYQQWLETDKEELVSVKAIKQPLRNAQGQILPATGNAIFWLEDSILKIEHSEHFFQSMPRAEQPCHCFPIAEHIQPVLDGASFAASLAQYKANPIKKAQHIKVFLTDVDGVMTDAGMYYIEGGQELKKFHVHDGMALQQLQKSGVKTGIITSEDTEIVSKRAAKLKVDYLHQGKRFGGKLQAALDICEKEGITLQEVAYIGDDINCLDLLQAVGIAACPANATRHIKAIPGIWQLERGAGEGVVREMIEKLFPEVI